MQFTTKWYRQDGTEIASADDMGATDNEYAVSKCECGGRVRISQVGTAEYAYCSRGHKWQYSYGANGHWMQLQ